MASKQNLSPETLARRAAYDGSEAVKKRRAVRNAARREMEEKGIVRKGDGKDVAHKRALVNGGSNAPSNLKVSTPKANRGWRRGGRKSP